MRLSLTLILYYRNGKIIFSDLFYPDDNVEFDSEFRDYVNSTLQEMLDQSMEAQPFVMDEPIHESEVKSCINKLNNGKAQGGT